MRVEEDVLGGNQVLLACSGGAGSLVLLHALARLHSHRFRTWCHRVESISTVKSAFTARSVDLVTPIRSERKLAYFPFNLTVLVVDCSNVQGLCKPRLRTAASEHEQLLKLHAQVKGTHFPTLLLPLEASFLPPAEFSALIASLHTPHSQIVADGGGEGGGIGSESEVDLSGALEAMNLLFRKVRTADAREGIRERLMRHLIDRTVLELGITRVLFGTTSDQGVASVLSNLAGGDAAAVEDARPHAPRYLPTNLSGVGMEGDGGGGEEEEKEVEVEDKVEGEGEGEAGAVGGGGEKRLYNFLELRPMLGVQAKEAACLARFLGSETFVGSTFFTGVESARAGLTAVGHGLIGELIRHSRDGSGLNSVLAAVRKLNPLPPPEQGATRCCALCSRWMSKVDTALSSAIIDATSSSPPPPGLLAHLCHACRILAAEAIRPHPATMRALGHGADASYLFETVDSNPTPPSPPTPSDPTTTHTHLETFPLPPILKHRVLNSLE